MLRNYANKFLDILAEQLWTRVLKKHYDEWEYQRMKEREDLWKQIMETPDGEE